MEHLEAKRLIEQQFTRGQLEPAFGNALRCHLRGCSACRKEYDRTAELEAVLEGQPDAPSQASIDRLLAAGAPEPARPVLSLASIGTGASVLAACAAAAFLLVPKPDVDSTSPEFIARGQTTTGSTQAFIRVFTKSEAGVLETKERLRQADGLLFSYSNLKSSGNTQMAIAGRDSSGSVHWYHPAFQSADDNPRSVPIELGVADRELAEAVYAQHAVGPLEVCALFSSAPFPIKPIDRAVEHGDGWPTGDKFCVKLQVLP